ncbi:MAG: YjjG family noncanonical pyrimidine nucleotidase [Clostridia bacterium]|nr:YjjG family noncanonical pyrimidine nucleotidase [Clostridia bacterium]
MYTSLFLDLDNTLLDFQKSEAYAIKKVLISHNLPHSEQDIKTYSAINLSYWKRYERGEIPKSAIFEGRFATLLDYFGTTGDIKSISKQYFEELSEGYFKIDFAEDILCYLKSRGYKLYATTNGIAQTQFKRIKYSKIEPYFDDVFVSENTGHQKPKKEYFEYVINHIEEKDRAKMLIIGDSQSSDILGGLNAGIDTCWYNPENQSPKYPSKYEISSLLALKTLL